MGMDIKEAEERTKIRARYLRALEAEDWEVLPEAAYVRGFLRAYGQILDLDGEVLADEFRRRYEEPASRASAAAEPVLQERRRPPGSRPPSRGPLIIGVGVGIVALLVLLGLLGGGDDDPAPSGGDLPARDAVSGNNSQRGKNSAKRGGKDSAPLVPVDLSIEPLDTIELCLVAGGDEALIDTQVLAAGAAEQFGDVKNYRLDLAGAGEVRLTVGGESQRLQSEEAASFEADSEGIREIDYAGPDCP